MATKPETPDSWLLTPDSYPQEKLFQQTLIIGHEIEKKAQDQGSETLALNFINYRGKTLNVPARFSPDLDFLNYHRYHIFQG